MDKNKDYYTEKLEKIENKLELFLEETMNDSRYKNPKAEQYVIALSLARNYIKEKIDGFCIEPHECNCNGNCKCHESENVNEG